MDGVCGINAIYKQSTRCMYSKEEAYSKIAELVEKFSYQIDSYKEITTKHKPA